MSVKQLKILVGAFVAASAAVLVYKLIFIYLNIDKGFDMLDEAFLLMDYRNPNLYKDWLQEIHTFIYALFRVLHAPINILNLHIAKVFFEITYSVALPVVVLRYCQRQNIFTADGAAKLIITGFVFLGVYLTTTPPFLCQYDFTDFFVFNSFALLLFLLSYPEREKLTVLAWLVLGIFIALQFFVKFSSSLLTLIYALGILLYIGKRGLLNATVLTAGLAFGTIGFFIMRGLGPVAWWQVYQQGFNNLKLVGYDIPDIVVDVYVKIDLILNGKILLLAGVVFGVLYYALQKVLSINRAYFISAAAAMGSMFLAPYFFTLNSSFRSIEPWYYRFIDIYLFLILSSLFHFYRANVPIKQSGLFLGVHLFSACLFAFVGSDTPFSDIAYEHILPVFLIVAVLGVLAVQSKQAAAFALIAVTMILCNVVQFYYYRTYPYHLLEPLYEQKYASAVTENIKVDKQLFTFITGVDKVLRSNSYANGNSMVALTNMPGVVYLMKAYAPGTYIYFQDSISTPWNCHFMEKMDCRQINNNAFLLMQKNLSMDNSICLNNMLQRCAIKRDSLGAVYNPFLRDSIFIYRMHN